ncbi:hypothetical protein BGZ73_007605 [Actinomortierella ambigua]|nr:hypothetical protein BGZ73_007605 [Actinomortierella ambigua]
MDSTSSQEAGIQLGGTSLKINTLRDMARKELINVLDSVQGKKTLDHGVEAVCYLQSELSPTQYRNIIYICRPQVNYMQYIANHVRSHPAERAQGMPYSYALFFVPRTTALCEKVLADEGVSGSIKKGVFQLDFIPMEDDLLSLEMDSTFRELYLEHDTSPIYYAAKALMRLQQTYGLFPRILGKGDYSKALCDLMLRMRRELPVDGPESLPLMNFAQNIDSLIIIDRSVDLVTPLCTQLTYEGLIDEVMHIKHSYVERDISSGAPSSVQSKGVGAASSAASVASSGQASTAGKKKKVLLSNGDKLYSRLRNLNFSVVGSLLNRVAKRINADYEERHNAKTVGQIRQFVSRLTDLSAEHQSLRFHTTIAEEIMAYTTTDKFNRILEVQQNLVAGINTSKEPEYIEEMINKQEPLIQVLRLLCLYSLVNGGLKQKQLEFFKHEILEAYGYEHLTTLDNLRQLGMLTLQTTTKNTYSLVSKSLRLIVDEVNEQEPNDISYVYSGYAPLSVRLIQCVVQRGNDGSKGSKTGGSSSKEGGLHGGWKGFEDVLRLLPGRTFDEVQRIDDGLPRSSKRLNGQPRTSLVFFLGGCTYTEISAVRFLAKQDNGQREFVVCTSQILNGHSLLDSVVQKPPIIGR